MDVVIVGSIAYDSIHSPEGHISEALGGAATYAGISCVFHCNRLNSGDVGIVGVVGTDFDEKDRLTLLNQGLDLSGVETSSGRTFRWTGSYQGNMAEAETIETQLNVFENFEAIIPSKYSSPKITLCANLHPSIQKNVLKQSLPSRLSLLDSMNLWIEIARNDLIQVMSMVDIIIINDGEVRLLADDENIVRAGKKVMEMTSARFLIIKRGEHGVLAFHPDGLISLPAFATQTVIDPTGCGDTFAGTLAAYLAKGNGKLTKSELYEGLIAATVTSSFTLSAFGIKGLIEMDKIKFEKRLLNYLSMIRV